MIVQRQSAVGIASMVINIFLGTQAWRTFTLYLSIRREMTAHGMIDES
jgi:hypothetical protein